MTAAAEQASFADLTPETPQYRPGYAVVSFRVYGVPIPQGSHVAQKVPGRQFSRVAPVNETALLKWRYLVQTTAAAEMGSVAMAESGQPVRVWLEFVRPKPPSTPKKVLRIATNPDLDKLGRGVLDGLHGTVYRDDGQVDELVMRKRFCNFGEPEHLTITAEIGPKP